MLLQDAIDAFLANLLDRALSPSYISSVALRLKRLSDSFPAIPLSDIQERDVNKYFRELKEVGLAEATRAGHASSVKAFFNFCVRYGFLPYSPASGLPRLSYKPVHRRAAPRDSVLALIKAIPEFAAHRDYHPRDVKEALAVSLGVDSGARLGEIQSLLWSRVHHALERGHLVKEGRVVYTIVGYGKTEASFLKFFSETATLFSLWEKSNPWKDSNFVFCSLRTGERQQASSLGRAFERICKFADIPPFRSQAVRKRNVTDMIRQTGDWKAGQLLAGHANLKVTMEHYNDIMHEDMDDNVAAMATERRGGGGAALLAEALFMPKNPKA